MCCCIVRLKTYRLDPLSSGPIISYIQLINNKTTKILKSGATNSEALLFYM